MRSVPFILNLFLKQLTRLSYYMVPFPYPPVLKFLVPKLALKTKIMVFAFPPVFRLRELSRNDSRLPPDREAVRAKLISSGVLGTDAYVVVAGPANVYAHYVTTREEYAVQRYEGASTIFGQCKCYLCQAILCLARHFILLGNVTAVWCIWGCSLWFNLKLHCPVFMRDLMGVESHLRTLDILAYPFFERRLTLFLVLGP